MPREDDISVTALHGVLEFFFSRSVLPQAAAHGPVNLVYVLLVGCYAAVSAISTAEVLSLTFIPSRGDSSLVDVSRAISLPIRSWSGRISRLCPRRARGGHTCFRDWSEPLVGRGNAGVWLIKPMQVTWTRLTER